ncbi:hypothetical protein ABW21_db0207420 [Orbilia brochopaga]|nr:hypothetical protein ABW21_db0207420 [Drechslerella brochopaga]
MPRKAFVADLQQVQAHSPHPAVSNINKGEDDGSFTFSVTLATAAIPVEVTALIPELSSYPSDHECVLFITSDGAPETISDAIESLNVRATTVSNIINATVAAISTKRGTKRQHSTDVEFDSDAMDVDFDPEDELDDEGEENFGGDDDDDERSIGGWSSVLSDAGLAIGDSQVAGSFDPMESEYIDDFCRDLRDVKSAGFKVGVLGALPGGSGYVAVSIRISKLGISDEAMTAWRLSPDKYLILLMHYPSGYKPLSTMAKDAYNAKRWLQFYVGTSSSYKPSLQEAITAFTKVKKFKEDQDGNIHVFKGEGGRLDIHGLGDSQSSTSNAAPTFEGTFISRPVSELLNERLLAIALYRVNYGFGWDGAELFYEDFQGRERADTVEDKYFQEDPGFANLPPIVHGDALKGLNTEAAPAFPLVAMQYLLRHFVRCTEFCLVCHNKISANFEALKPYVCDKPLCLYQYMALGFGPSMEYEILDQPSVIDLLVSFCWASAAYHKLSDFPIGLNLTVPPQGTYPFSAIYDKGTQELSLPTEPEGAFVKLNTGDWIVMIDPNHAETIHCRVVDAEYFPHVRLSVGSSNSESNFLANKEHFQFPDSNKIPVQYGVYNVRFDELAEQERRTAIVQMLDTLPSVNEMRDWLVLNTKVGEEISLKTWKNRISPSALLLLRWIVASNRSCIVQIDETPDDTHGSSQVKTPPNIAEAKDHKKSIIGEERVHGMEGYLQFRFAMGAPDKEQRFVNEVRNAVQNSGLQYPTLFAFHGSPIQNWHSIIREGLHFRETSHGRAYGHGVYHSLDAHISLGYTRTYHYTPAYSTNPTARWWSKSHLCINNALCLNEIVNLPSQYVSKAPHLVVNKLDWIQTRYLFVHTERPAVILNQDSEHTAPVPARTLPQDPSMTPRGIGHKNLVIPETASTVRTRNGNNQNISQHQGQPSAPKKSKLSSTFGRMMKVATGSFADPIRIDDDGYTSAATDDEDMQILFLNEKGKATAKGASAAKDGNKKTNKKKSASTFVPGQLDISSIEMLAEPPYASPMATKRIQQELRSLLKIQETHDLEELGWYINHQHIENVYQWIVEFHSFESSLPLAEDMKKSKVNSIVTEIRFGKDFPMTPPFFRVISPRFLPFQRRGGGHVTAGGALCMELLTNSGWSAVSSLESVFLQIRLAMSSLEPYPARLEGGADSSYSVHEAKDAFVRACRTHGWQVPPDFSSII